MKLDYYPHYCGGRILAGLWINTGNPPPPNGWLAHFRKHMFTNHQRDQKPEETDYYSTYMPPNLNTFQQCMRWGLVDQAGGICAVITAVTQDSSQKQARQFLEATGFKPIFTGRKSPGANTCTTWLADVQNGPILKILREVKYDEIKNAKFG